MIGCRIRAWQLKKKCKILPTQLGKSVVVILVNLSHFFKLNVSDRGLPH